MKNSTKILQAIFCMLLLFSFSVHAQTNVSGGIYANTTWTLANSPYIVTDTIVVFPTITLTIEPGVTVKFDDNKVLELRQSTLIAVGTATDSITFTSNSVSPYPGIWGKVFMTGTGNRVCRLSYCNFKYGSKGFQCVPGGQYTDTVFLKHSHFDSNVSGFDGYNNFYSFVDSCDFTNNTSAGVYGTKDINHSTFRGNATGITYMIYNVENCYFDSNQLGIFGFGAQVTNCILRNNLTGIQMNTLMGVIDNCIINHGQSGVWMIGSTTLKNSVIDSNSVAGVTIIGSFSTAQFITNCQIKYNDIGLFDSTSVGSIITGNQIDSNNIGIIIRYSQDTVYCNSICGNTNWGLQYLQPSSTSFIAGNYWCTNDSATVESYIYDGYDNITWGLVNYMPIDTLQCFLSTGISSTDSRIFSATVFPNPVHDKLNVVLDNNVQSEIVVYDLLSHPLVRTSFSRSISINTQSFSAGIYLYQVRSKNGGFESGRFVKE